MSSDAIVVLKADHKEIRNLFRKFQAAGDKAVKKKSKIVGQIIELLTVHTYIENEVMYPEVCALLPDLKDSADGRAGRVVPAHARFVPVSTGSLRSADLRAGGSHDGHRHERAAQTNCADKQAADEERSGVARRT